MNYNEFINDILSKRENVKFKHSELHHIIPKCMGGNNDISNLIYLTCEEHFIAHKLLALENPNNRGLNYAFWMMCNQVKHFNAEDYTLVKLQFIDSHFMKGENNPNFGHKWNEDQKLNHSKIHKGKYIINNGKYEKFINLNENIPTGFVKGGLPKSEEHKLNLSKAQTGKKYSDEINKKKACPGNKNGMYGVHHTDEAKMKMSKNHYDCSGNNNPRAKSVICIELNVNFGCIQTASIETKQNRHIIKDCCDGKRNVDKYGNHWKYMNV